MLLFHQTIKRRDAIGGFASTKDPSVVDIQSTEVNPSPAAFVSILDAARTTWLVGLRWVEATTSLNARLLISGDDEFIGFQRLSFPSAGIQIQQAAGLLGKMAHYSTIAKAGPLPHQIIRRCIYEMEY